MTKYTYTKTVRSDQLEDEIKASAITIAEHHIDTSGSDIDIWFQTDLSAGEIIILDALVAAHIPVAYVSPVTEVSITNALDTENNITVAVQPRTGSGVTYISHNLADPKTWWMNALKHTDVVLSPKVAGVYTTYSFMHELIDTGNGKITFEDRKFDTMGDDYIRPVIKKNGVAIAFNPVSISNTYTINYSTNEITFSPALTNSDVVTATYYSVVDSTCIIKPSSGKKLRIEKVECQFSKNVDFSNRWLVFQPYVYLTAYGTSVAYGEPAIYKSIMDYMNESNNSAFTVIPATGGLTQDIYSFVWEYPVSKDICYNTNAKLARIDIYVYDPVTGVKNLPLTAIGGGALEYSTVTFYCLSESLPI